MDPQAILAAANVLSLPTLILVTMAGLIFAGVKIIGWGAEVTKLLGNHLRHDLAAQTESLARIELSLTEQTLVIRALGRMLMENATGRNSLDRKDF